MSYNEKKFLMRVGFAAALLSVFGCGEVTPLAPDGGGGAAGRETLSTGGAKATGGNGGEKATGGATGGQAGAGPPAGGAAGAPTGSGGSVGGTAGQAVAADGGAGKGSAGQGGGGGAVIMTVDAGSLDASACPRTLKTSALQPTLSTLNGTSTGVSELAWTATGGGPSGNDPVSVLYANMSAQPDPNNPPAGSLASVVIPVVQDCNGAIETGPDLMLQGYSLSLWVYIQGLSCDKASLPIWWRVGIVSDSGTTFPWGTQEGGLTMSACSGTGATITWANFPANARAHAIVVQFANVSQQAFSGLIDVSDVALKL